MVWDFTEANPFSDSSGNVMLGIDQVAKMIVALGFGSAGLASQGDAATQLMSQDKVVSTDPPYYDNIRLRGLVGLLLCLAAPLAQAQSIPTSSPRLRCPRPRNWLRCPYRHGGKDKAEAFFLDGMTQAMHRLAEQAHPAFPVTIYYAFKQSENEGEEGTASTGWETFLDAVIRAGFAISGTWPMRTEYTGNLEDGTNALASSIILVCRPRAARRSHSNAPRVRHRAQGRIARRPRAPAARQYRAGGFGPGGHRSRHGGLYPL